MLESELNIQTNEKDLQMSVCHGPDQTVFSVPCLNLVHLYACALFTRKVFIEQDTRYWSSEDVNRLYYPDQTNKGGLS